MPTKKQRQSDIAGMEDLPDTTGSVVASTRGSLSSRVHSMRVSGLAQGEWEEHVLSTQLCRHPFLAKEMSFHVYCLQFMARGQHEADMRKAEAEEERRRAAAEWNVQDDDRLWEDLAAIVRRAGPTRANDAPRETARRLPMVVVRDHRRAEASTTEDLPSHGRRSFRSFNPKLERYQEQRNSAMQDDQAHDEAMSTAVTDDAFADRMAKIKRKADAIRSKVGASATESSASAASGQPPAAKKQRKEQRRKSQAGAQGGEGGGKKNKNKRNKRHATGEGDSRAKKRQRVR